MRSLGRDAAPMLELSAMFAIHLHRNHSLKVYMRLLKLNLLYLVSFISGLAVAGDVLEPSFPYNSSPDGNVCVSADYYATRETMLGSWAMLNAVELDVNNSILPEFLQTNNVVYAVGTAAIGNELGIENCAGGCNELNGVCFALKFNDKQNFPYMIFQSVNIAANSDTFDIYMAGGGSGAFPEQCKAFWGTGDSVNWGNNILNTTCSGYFGDYSNITSAYTVTYDGITHTAKETLKNACEFASPGEGNSGFNTQNWYNVSVVPVTCPKSLTQITGLAIDPAITTIGKQKIHLLNSLSENDFAQTTITDISTTQMQDCKTPSSGYCNNILQPTLANYESSISATTTEPKLSGSTPSSSYCEDHADATYCSWNNGESSGSDYCNKSQSQCYDCGGGPQWCTCNGKILTICADDEQKARHQEL